MGNPFAALYRQPVRQVEVVRVVAFYTNDAYAREARALHESLQAYALHYQTVHVAGLVTWAEAVMYKPRFILTCLREMQADAVFYTDADSEFRKKPDWSIFKDVDVSWSQFKRGMHHPVEHLTGSMFFRNTPEVRSFVEDWAQETSLPGYAARFTPEMDSLRVTWELKTATGPEVWSKRLRYLDLPSAWVCWDERKEIDPSIDPVIWHRQASRRHRHGKKDPQTQAAAAPPTALGDGVGDGNRPPPESGAAGG